MKIRRFEPEDSTFCFRTRCAAFIQKFYEEIGPEAVSAGVNAYMPDDYIQMSSIIEIFIIEEKQERKGFFAIKRTDAITAEIPFIYIDLKFLDRGYGSKTIQYIEKWIESNWPKVEKIFLNTIIPKYNGGFYKKMGFKLVGKSCCIYGERSVKAKRFEKQIKKM
jgi:GNAT superfamily N-acetyltransferase